MSFVTVGVSVGGALLGRSKEKKAQKRQDEEEARQADYERERQQKIDTSRAVIDRSFNAPARQKQYADFVGALREHLSSELVRQKSDTARSLKFALARAGQTGGSVAADTNARLGDEYSRGALDNERTAQGALADLRGQDQSARLGLLQLADQGLSATDAPRRAGEALEDNLGRANITGLGKGFGDFFAETAKTADTIKRRVQERRGFGYRANRQDLYG